MKCQGWRRYGGAFSLGPVRWEQCDRKPVAMLKVRQDGKDKWLAACPECWTECIENEITILEATPIKSEEKTE